MLRGGLAGILDRPGAERFAMCGTTAPGRPTFERVTCARPHAWRAVRSVGLAATARDDGRHPGAAVVREAGRSTCRDAGQRAAAGGVTFSWGYEWPSAAQWSGGRTYGLCWAPD